MSHFNHSNELKSERLKPFHFEDLGGDLESIGYVMIETGYHDGHPEFEITTAIRYTKEGLENGFQTIHGRDGWFIEDWGDDTSTSLNGADFPSGSFFYLGRDAKSDENDPYSDRRRKLTI